MIDGNRNESGGLTITQINNGNDDVYDKENGFQIRIARNPILLKKKKNRNCCVYERNPLVVVESNIFLVASVFLKIQECVLIVGSFSSSNSLYISSFFFLRAETRPSRRCAQHRCTWNLFHCGIMTRPGLSHKPQ